VVTCLKAFYVDVVHMWAIVKYAFSQSSSLESTDLILMGCYDGFLEVTQTFKKVFPVFNFFKLQFSNQNLHNLSGMICGPLSMQRSDSSSIAAGKFSN
jgi:hypothetical protein